MNVAKGRPISAAALVLVLTACGSPAEPSEAATQRTDIAPTASAAIPDLAACPGRELLEKGLRERTRPIPIPAALKTLMRADMDNFAVRTFDGSTACVDASWMEQISDAALSEDERFVSFDWMGYEAFGQVIVDRTGKGTVIDTGVPPIPSPSGKRIAALDYSESGYGALNALAVWDVSSTGVREMAKLESLPELFGWRLDRWGTETCLELSGIRWDDVPQDPERYDDAPRQHFLARLNGGSLQLTPAPAGGCTPA